jgi:hypothetical protein
MPVLRLIGEKHGFRENAACTSPQSLWPGARAITAACERSYLVRGTGLACGAGLSLDIGIYDEQARADMYLAHSSGLGHLPSPGRPSPIGGLGCSPTAGLCMCAPLQVGDR